MIFETMSVDVTRLAVYLTITIWQVAFTQGMLNILSYIVHNQSFTMK